MTDGLAKVDGKNMKETYPIGVLFTTQLKNLLIKLVHLPIHT